MSLLADLIATSGRGLADSLRDVAAELQQELPFTEVDGSRRPSTRDILVCAEVPYVDRRVQFVALRLLSMELVAVELYERHCPFDLTETQCIYSLATFSLTGVAAVKAALQRFVTEARLRGARGIDVSVTPKPEEEPAAVE